MSSVLGLFWKIFVEFVAAFVRLFWKPSAKSIRGEIALVTGAGQGMGRLLCFRLAELGAKIIAVDVKEKANEETVEIIKQNGSVAFGYTVDLSNAKEIHRLASRVRDEVGDVTMLINNAGVVYPNTILSVTEEMIFNTFHVNVISHFLLIKEFLPSMKENNHGHIFAMASYAGLFGLQHMIDYSASKHAVVGLMEGLRQELRKENLDGINLTCFCPTFVNTDMVKRPQTQLGSVLVLTPEYTVNESVDAILRNKFLVSLPSATVLQIMREVMPDAVMDALSDHALADVTFFADEDR